MIDEVLSSIKAKPPQTPEQARVASLQNQKDAASKALKAERNRQKIKRAQQQISAARANIQPRSFLRRSRFHPPPDLR